ncbi:MAG: hypothetical protein AAF581_07455 [Planctomycetota bacterium]
MIFRTLCTLLVAVGVVAWAAPPAWAKERSARKIIKDFDRVKYPGWINDISMEDYAKLVIPPTREQCALALELRENYPRHKEVPRLMLSRWVLTINVFDGYDQVLEETTDALENSNFVPLENAAAIGRAMAALTGHRLTVERRFELVKDAVKRNSKDTDYGPFLLTQLAVDHIANPDKQRDLCELAIKKFGKEHCWEAGYHLRLLKKLGTDVPFQFKDALTGETVRRDDTKPTLIYAWWPSEKTEPAVEGLRKLKNVQVIFVHTYYTERREETLAAARAMKLPGPLLNIKQHTSIAKTLGFTNGGTFFLINKSGRLAAVTGHLDPMREVLQGK